MFIETIKVVGLANSSYVIGSEQSGQCAVIDPVRDVDQYTTIASNHGVRISYALETHLHNDFISGARELAAQTGCQVGASASGGTLFPSVRLEDGDEFDLGEFKLKVLHTPGHTPEHISYLVEEQGEPHSDIHRRRVDHGRCRAGGLAGEPGCPVPGPVVAPDDPR